MEALTLEYTCLLTNQLEDQRRYWEKKLAESEKARSSLEKMALAQVGPTASFQSINSDPP